MDANGNPSGLLLTMQNYSGQTSSLGLATIIPSLADKKFFYTQISIELSEDASLAIAGLLSVNLKDGGAVIANGASILPASPGVIANPYLITQENVMYSSGLAGNSLGLLLPLGLVSGSLTWSCLGGYL